MELDLLIDGLSVEETLHLWRDMASEGTALLPQHTYHATCHATLRPIQPCRR